MAKHTNRTSLQTTSGEAARPLNDSDLHHQIETRAFEIWLASGGSHGNDVTHWLQAEKEILAEPRNTQISPLGLGCYSRPSVKEQETNT